MLFLFLYIIIGIDRNTKNVTYLLRIRGTTTYSTQAIQVNCKASSLNSNCCFVLRRGKRSYVWCGSNSTGDQRELAKGFVGKDCELVLEGMLIIIDVSIQFSNKESLVCGNFLLNMEQL